MVLAVLVAAVAAAPQFLPYAGYTGLPYAAAPGFAYGYGAYGASPLAYTAAAAPVAYTAAAAPVAYAAAPVAYAAPGPISYQTGAKVVAKYEPVEQHGYQIAY
jgi:hypothetical protein